MTVDEEVLHTTNLNVIGNVNAPILVVCDAPSVKVFETGLVMTPPAMNLFMTNAEQFGFEKDDFIFITPCPPIPDEAEGSAKRENIFMGEHTEEFQSLLLEFPNIKSLVYLGAKAGRQVTGRPVKITKSRGKIIEIPNVPVPVLSMFSPNHVLRRPENQEIFETDFIMLNKLAEAGWDTSVLEQSRRTNDYKFCFDLTGWLVNPPKALGVDLESKGGYWYQPTCKILSVQLSAEEGKSLVIPLDVDWFNSKVPEGCDPLTYRRRAMLRDQLRQLLGNPNVFCTGSNFGGDLHKLRKEGIEVANWAHETQQLVFNVDENTYEKGLDSSIRRWIPDLSGYADRFNAETDKEHMERVKPEDMLDYSGGDPDASKRLTVKLVKKGREDSRQWNCYKRLQMPALRTFNEMEEIGIRIDKQALRELGVVAEEETHALYDKLIAQVPASIRRLHQEEGLSFTRAEFIIDILFRHPDGFKLTPVVWTDGTKKLKDISKRKPSTSKKDHLPYFKYIPFVADLIEWKTLDKMCSTYIGKEGGQLIEQRRRNAPAKYTEPTGFWKYLDYEDRIFPTYFLHRAVTGRTSSAYPNFQNIPKRGRLAKAFRKIFIPTEGYVFVDLDISQAELRVAAWMANETNMLRIYREGGDIHEYTAAAIMGVRYGTFKAWKGSDIALPEELRHQTVIVETYGELYDLKRYQAKSVAFGFLYGMGWRKFKTYAKTDYDLEFTDEEAQEFRRIFFQLYPKLEAWHIAMREFVNKHGYVRALHGAIRHLPNIYSADDIVKGECERQAINSPVQRFASDLCLMAMIRFGRDADWDYMRLIAMIHDSLITEVRIGYEEEAMSALKFFMENPPLEAWFDITAPLPIVSEVSMSATNLSEMDEQSDVVAEAPEWFRPRFRSSGMSDTEDVTKSELPVITWERGPIAYTSSSDFPPPPNPPYYELSRKRKSPSHLRKKKSKRQMAKASRKRNR